LDEIKLNPKASTVLYNSGKIEKIKRGYPIVINV
jgi:hypothetical protein